MSLENWYVLATQPKYHDRKNAYSVDWQPTRARKIFLISAALLLVTAVAYPIFSNGHTNNGPLVSGSTNRVVIDGAPIGVVYVNPGDVPLQAIGSSFAVQVKVANMAQFNGWDIQIVTGERPFTINATSLSISGNIFAANTTGGSPFEIVHCVNGAGTGCTSSDGPGIVHSAFGDTAFTSGGGLLFTISYTVVGSSSYNPLTIQNSLISSSSPSGVAHFDQSAAYGVVPGFGGGAAGRRVAT